MNVLHLSTNQKYLNEKYILKMNTCLRNTVSKLYNTVSALVAGIWDALAGRLQRVRKTASLLYSKMMDNIRYGRERLKNIVERRSKKRRGKTTDKKQGRFNTSGTWQSTEMSVEKLCNTSCQKQTLIVILIKRKRIKKS